MKAQRTRLAVQALEDRTVPAVYNPWPDPGHLTISFAPDNTSIDGAPSQLNQKLGPSTSTWELTILRAFQTWASQINVNVAVVPDDGAPFGSPGPLQGSAQHGDIRIGARSLGTTDLAITTPFDLIGNWAGDVVLNTDEPFNLGGTNGAYDLYTVFVHEAGHALGLPDNNDTSSVMFENYLYPRTGLSTGDVSSIQAIYGVRSPDRFDASQSNNTMSSATSISLLNSLQLLQGQNLTTGVSPYIVAGDLTTSTDVDYYRITTLSLLSVTLRFRTSGLSSLKAKVTLYNFLGTPIASATATDPTNGDLTITTPALLPLSTYYVKVEKAASDVFGEGAYLLSLGSVSATLALNDPVMAGLISQDSHSNDSPNQATDLSGNVNLYAGDLRWNYTVRASLSDSTDADWYKVKSPSAGSSDMLVAVWGMAAGGVDPVVTVLDANKHPVAADVVTDQSGIVTLQIRNPAANSNYYIGVTSNPATGNVTGNYFLGSTFKQPPIETSEMASATLTQATPAVAATLTVYQSQLYHFDLSATSVNPAAASAMRMSILDANGNEIFTLFVPAGSSASGDVVLPNGTYTIVFTGGTPDGSSLPDLSFDLEYLVRSDPIGVSPSNTSSQPSGSSNTSPSTTPTTTYNGSYTSPYRPT